MPVRCTAVGERAHGKRGGVDQRRADRAELGRRGGEPAVLHCVVAVGHHGVHGHSLRDCKQSRQRVAGHAHPAHQARLLEVPQRGNGLVCHLGQGSELDVVALDQVNSLDTESAYAVAHAAGDAFGREVEGIVAVPADSGGQQIPVTIHATQGFAQYGLGSGQPVVRRHIEEVDPGIKGRVHRAMPSRSAKVP
jgi:hypothetical protein